MGDPYCCKKVEMMEQTSFGCVYVFLPVCLSVSLSIFLSVCLSALIIEISHQQENLQCANSPNKSSPI